ncbi:hypothetical protein ABK040_002194 [Willaertia magna]
MLTQQPVAQQDISLSSENFNNNISNDNNNKQLWMNAKLFLPPSEQQLDNNNDNNTLHHIEIENGIITNIIKVSNNNTNNTELEQQEQQLLTTHEYQNKNYNKIINLNGKLLLPPFIEPHIHLDTTMTAGQPKWNESGTLFEGIERWSERKKYLTINDVKERAKKVLKLQILNGIQFVRTHIDTTDRELIALKAMIELKEEMKELITIQIVAFPQEGIVSFQGNDCDNNICDNDCDNVGLKLFEKAVAMDGVDVIGGIPHYEFSREDGVESIRHIFKLAKKYNNKLIDIHCDEIDDEQSRFLEVVASETIKNKYQGKVTVSHTTAMGSYNDAYTFKLFRFLKMSNLNFISNPLVNIHLQGRFDSYPKRRGLTRVKELVENGLNVCFGHDDVFDPWYPLGNANMLQVLHMGVHCCQLMGYSELKNALNYITYNSAKTLQIDDNKYGIKIGNEANFIVLNTNDSFSALRFQSEILYNVRKGKNYC